MNAPLTYSLETEPHEIVTKHYRFPFPLRPYQVEAVNELSPLDASALWWKPGLGKTAGATATALYKLITGSAQKVLVIIPPILHVTWGKWLRQVTHADGRALKVLHYEGGPTKRAALNLNDAEFIIVGIQIFKKDYERFEALEMSTRLHVICDEAQSLKSVSSDNHKKYRALTHNTSHQLLSGTPITSSPVDGYAMCKLKSPIIYRNLNQFLRIHVAALDFYNKPVEWHNLDLLADNMAINAKFASKEEHLADLPEKIISTLEYDLDPAHLKLYQKMLDDQILKLPDNQKIDLTQVTALYHAMGQVIMGWDHFTGDASKKAQGWNIVEEVLDELGAGKLMLFCTYKRTNAAVTQRYAEKYGAVAVYGDISPAQKNANIARFIEDPACRLITIQTTSAQGLDGLQDVCSDCLFLETPTLASQFEQALSRLDRSGQRKSVTVRLAIARKTVQQHLLLRLLHNEDLVCPLIRTRSQLREALLGQ